MDESALNSYFSKIITKSASIKPDTLPGSGSKKVKRVQQKKKRSRCCDASGQNQGYITADDIANDKKENRYSEIGSQAMKDQSMRSLPNLNARNMFPQEQKQTE